MSKQEDFHLPEKLLKKTRAIDNDARILKEAKTKRKLNKNQKCVIP